MLGIAGIAYSQTPKQPFTITISALKPSYLAGRFYKRGCQEKTLRLIRRERIFF